MNKINLFLMGTLLALSFSLSGCQGNNSDTPVEEPTIGGEIPIVPDVNSTSVTVILPKSAAVLTTNSQVVNIDVRIFDSANNPYSTGNVTKVNPSDVLLGRDIGSFDKTTATIVNGVASFVYTGPADLTEDTSNILFSFYHSSDSTKAKTFTASVVPEADQSVSTTYELRTSSADGVSMNLSSAESVSYSVYNLDQTIAVDDMDIKSITVTSLNPSLANLTDSKGNSGTSLTITNHNNISLNINSNTKSGIVPIKVFANFKDANGDDFNLTRVFSILILSGPPSAISLSYAGFTQDTANAKFIEQWVVTVADKYSNLVNTHPAVSSGLLAGYRQSSAPNDYNTLPSANTYLHYAPDSALEDGAINAINNTLTSQTAVFNNVDDQNDILVVYGTGYKYDASGKWDITTNTGTILDLTDDYNSTNRSGLGFAVGNNQREDTCDSGSKWVANVYSSSGASIVGDNGSLILNVSYDYYLVGKSTMLWVNLVGIQNSTSQQIRLGEAKKITLRGNSLKAHTSYEYVKGFTGPVTFNIKLTDTTAYYYNANFSFTPKVTGNGTAWSVTGTSMDNGIESCVNDGVAYVTITITNSPESGGTVSLEDVLVSKEF